MEASTHPHYADLEEILYSEEQVAKRVSELADKINVDYAGKEIVLIGILKGSVIFMTDLAKRLTVPATLDFMSVSSYGSGTESSGAVKIVMDARRSITGKHVLIVEDIVDTGLTLKYLLQLLSDRSPASLECVVLLKKPSRLQVTGLEVKYAGFEIPDKWVVGFGMDYDEHYRTLPVIGVLKEAIYKK
eukprot:TRINITY_DN2662_c0_g1_i1.p1 TRINITY_DN2662_c0_g1~~TRINITY_DN2662_c0_g1_i1.p1  ORF type:complete len:188 (-),score=47.82 TRINITY_DN2662_c0_g1_i1:480-1043(-)